MSLSMVCRLATKHAFYDYIYTQTVRDEVGDIIEKFEKRQCKICKKKYWVQLYPIKKLI